MNLKVKVLTGIILGAFVAVVFVPTGASADITIKNNGWFSKNHVSKHKKIVKKVEQRNRTNAKIGINIVSKTGWNEANGNTGEGETMIDTGNSRVTTTADVSGGNNENTSSEDGCCCGSDSDTEIVIQGNGSWSHNGVHVSDICKKIVEQSNSTSSNTYISTYSNTGGNEASGNTGGSTSIYTGNSTVTSTVTVNGGDNINE